MFRAYAALREPIAVPAACVALLPLGAMETHGPHLPLGTDGIIAEAIVDRAAALSPDTSTVLRLPLLWLGASAEHAHNPGTLSRDAERLIAAIEDVGAGLARAGVRRVVLFNGHGGNVAAAAIAALKLRTAHGVLAASAHWLDFGMPTAFDPPTPVRADVHGGWVETSVMLHVAPALVDATRLAPRPARPPAPLLAPEGPIKWGWTSADLGGSWIGRPEAADAELGRRLFEHAAQGLCRLLREMAEAPWPASATP